MKRTLKEDLERIHGLTYGKKVLNESFIDNILNKVGLSSKDDTKKVDDPKKADLVSSDVQQFFDNIKKAADGGGLSQQGQGSMTYQKEVESMQIGLMMLGYELPKHGVDGLFGPETAEAVEKFKTDNKVKDSGTQEIQEGLTQLKVMGYSNLEFDTDGTQNDYVNDALLQDLNTAAVNANLIARITTAKTGHSQFVKGKNVVSRHMDQTAVDLSQFRDSKNSPLVRAIDAKGEIRNKIDTFVKSLHSMGYAKNVEGGNQKGVLWQTGGHYDHVHASNTGGVSKSSGLVTGSSTETSFMGTKATPEMLNKLLELLKQKGVTSEDLKKYIDSITTGGGVLFTDLDLKTEEGKRAYAEISQKFIDTRKPNLLGITGEMMLKGAETALEQTKKYIPPELALAQLAAEGGIGNADLESRPIKYKNPFNVGNTDDPNDNVEHGNVQSGINAYYTLIGRDYLGKGKTANDLVQKFVNKDGYRYATAGKYEALLSSIVPQVNRIAQPIYAKLNKTIPSDLA